MPGSSINDNLDGMTDSPTPKRKLTGAAVAGAYPRPKLYPKQLVVSVTEEVYDHIAEVAAENGLSKSDVARNYLDTGRIHTTFP